MDRPQVKWTPDCQGKQDYDGPIVDVSTRYWPRGGGFSVLSDGEFRTNENHEIRPSAHASICLRFEGGVQDWIDLTDARFEGETEAEVKVQVERWVQAEFERVRDAVCALYGKTR